MSIIRTSLNYKDLNQNIIKEIFTEINLHAAKSKFDLNKYSISRDEMRDVCLFGAKALLSKFKIDKNILNSIENNGCLNDNLTKDDIDRLVPKALLESKFSRAEFGLNLGGNHFLEMQYVDKINSKDNELPSGINLNDITVMTHLGPGPFTGNLMRIYSNRAKIPFFHRILYLIAKFYFHFYENRRPDLSILEIFKYFFKPDKYQSFDKFTHIGKDFLKIIQVGTNYGYAYQLATYAAVRDAIKKVTYAHNIKDIKVDLLWNVSHNSIYMDNELFNEDIVTRHNAVKTYHNKPTILAGSYDMSSCIGFCKKSNQKNNYMNTHDHGIGSLLDKFKSEMNLKTIDDISFRYFFVRGKPKVKSCKKAKLYSSQTIESIAEYFNAENVFTPWFYVKPIATLKI